MVSKRLKMCNMSLTRLHILYLKTKGHLIQPFVQIFRRKTKQAYFCFIFLALCLIEIKFSEEPVFSFLTHFCVIYCDSVGGEWPDTSAVLVKRKLFSSLKHSFYRKNLLDSASVLPIFASVKSSSCVQLSSDLLEIVEINRSSGTEVSANFFPEPTYR